MSPQTIYSINGFRTEDILSNMDDIDEAIEELSESEEYSKEKEFELVYKKFFEGLKLSTGIKPFQW